MKQGKRGPINVLYVDDYTSGRERVRDSLEKENGGFELFAAATPKEFNTLPAKRTYDIVLSDFNILGFEGFQVIEAVRETDPRIPVLIVNGIGAEESVVEAMQKGATDYVINIPSSIQRLPQSILAALEKKRLRNEREKLGC